MDKWSTSSAHSTWSDVWAVCTSRAGCTEGVRHSSCPWTHIRAPVVPGSLVWRGARSSSGSRYKVRRVPRRATCGGGDHKARRYVQSDLRHLTEIGSLTPQELCVFPVAFLEGINILRMHRLLLWSWYRLKITLR